MLNCGLSHSQSHYSAASATLLSAEVAGGGAGGSAQSSVAIEQNVNI